MADNREFTTPYSKQLSSALKERLKRSGRYHSSPSAPPSKRVRHSLTAPLDELPNTCELSNDSKKSNERYLSIQKDDNKKTSMLTHENQQTSENYSLDRCIRSTDTPVCSTSSGLQSDQVINNRTDDLQKTFTAENIAKPPIQSSESTCLTNTLLTQKNELRLIKKQKEEILRKLKLVKFYKEKHNLEDMQKIICKWRQVSQDAIVHLQSSLPDPKPKLTELINHLQIDQTLINFDPDSETFV